MFGLLLVITYPTGILRYGARLHNEVLLVFA